MKISRNGESSNQQVINEIKLASVMKISMAKININPAKKPLGVAGGGEISGKAKARRKA